MILLVQVGAEALWKTWGTDGDEARKFPQVRPATWQPSSGASSPFERRSRRSSKHQGPRESPLRPWTHQVECDVLGKRERKFLSRAGIKPPLLGVAVGYPSLDETKRFANSFAFSGICSITADSFNGLVASIPIRVAMPSSDAEGSNRTPMAPSTFTRSLSA